MYETVLNHTYKGKLEKETSDDAVKDPYDFGKWEKVKTTHLVCKIDNDGPTIITNTPGNHAEEKLIQELIKKSKVKEPTNSSDSESDTIDKLTKMSVEERKKSITIYINNSPCSQLPHNCTGELIEMLDNNVNVHLRLYVASLYKIRRKSCEEEYHNNKINIKNHRDNYTGLRNLMQHDRCKIKAFNENVWKELFRMTTGSDQLPGNYDEITEGNERSREDEDECIKKDLKHIRCNSL